MKRYDEYSRHLEVLKRAPQEDLTNEFIISGIVDKFFIQFELGWKVLKGLLSYEGNIAGTTGSPREVIKASYSCFDFLDESVWLLMLRERNDSAHIYDENAAKKLVQKILHEYIHAFEKMRLGIMETYKDELKDIA